MGDGKTMCLSPEMGQWVTLNHRVQATLYIAPDQRCYSLSIRNHQLVREDIGDFHPISSRPCRAYTISSSRPPTASADYGVCARHGT